jgi:hypothetical protein
MQAAMVKLMIPGRQRQAAEDLENINRKEEINLQNTS